MCRHLAWLGRPRSLADLMLSGPHSLLVQSYRPREQRYGTVNADGFGVGWYSAARPQPARYRRAQPIWTDPSFASLAGVVGAGCALAAVRSATEGMPMDESATAPFTAGPWLFSHNGSIDDVAALRSVLPPGTAVESAVDSALIWALLLHRLHAGQALPAALVAVVLAASAVTSGRFNLLATDGEQVVATRWGDTLYVQSSQAGLAIASEPGATGIEDGWLPVPDRSLVVADQDGLRIAAVSTPVVEGAAQ